MLKSSLSLSYAFLSFFCLSGCSPEVIQTIDEADDSATGEPAPRITEKAALTIQETDPGAASQVSEDLGTTAKSEPMNRQYQLLAEPWAKYFRGTPKLETISIPSSGILDLFNEEQKLIKMVLDSAGGIKEQSDYAEFQERLDELKTMIPEAETASGYVPSSSRKHTFVSGNTIYVRSAHRYYNGYYYTHLSEKHKSSSPALVRSVQGLVHNSSLEPSDLDQRINALQQLISQWSRRTSEMSPSGSSGIMREANEAYLDALRSFTKNFIELRSGVKKIEAAHLAQIEDKNTILERWKSFETNRLSILGSYVEQNSISSVEPNHDGIYTVASLSPDEQLVLVCKIGERDLYFDVSEKRHALHPFVLIDVTPIP
jgi:hypothetical protein